LGVPMANTRSSFVPEKSRGKLIQLIVTTAIAISLGVFEEVADPFGLDTASDRLSANIFNSITSPLYGKQSSIEIDGKSYDSRFGQSNIIVLLIDDSYLESTETRWPLDPRRYQRILRKLVDAGASAIFVDIYFTQNTPDRRQSLARLYRESSCLTEASACSTVQDGWSCSAEGKGAPPCSDPAPDAGTAIFFAGSWENPDVMVGGTENPDVMAGGTRPPAVALAQMRSKANYYNLRETAGNDTEYPTAGWALFEAWCRRDDRCEASRLDEFPRDPMYLHWGYAPNRMMTEISDFGAAVECVPQAVNPVGRLWQSIRIFLWNMIRGRLTAQIAPCPYTSQIKLQLFNNLTQDELQQLFGNKVVLLGASLKNFIEYQWSPVHDYIPGVFWHAMAVDNLMEFSDDYMKMAPDSVEKSLESVAIVVIFILQALLSWAIQKREETENLGEMSRVKLDLAHGLLIICLISASVLWMTGFNRWSPANWIGLAMLMFLIDAKPITAVPRFCWMILPTLRAKQRPFRYMSNLVLATLFIGIMLFIAYCIFIVPHALILSRDFNDTIISIIFMIAYLVIISICSWIIFRRKRTRQLELFSCMGSLSLFFRRRQI
jgi:hypothetical protein